MPSIRHNHREHRRFLPHFPPGPMRCEFSPELVPPLPHAMMGAFPKPENETTYRSPTSPLTPTEIPQQLIPKPPGEVSRVGRGGYTLKDLLEGQYEWRSGLYDKIRVFATRSYTSVILKPFSQEKVRSMADKYLDTSVSFSSQATPKVDLICEMVRYFYFHVDMQFITRQVSEEFPDLLKFEGNWVIHDYLRIYLKNSAQKAKKEQQQRDKELETAAKGKGKAKGASFVYTETTDGFNLTLRSSSQIIGRASLCVTF